MKNEAGVPSAPLSADTVVDALAFADTPEPLAAFPLGPFGLTAWRTRFVLSEWALVQTISGLGLDLAHRFLQQQSFPRDVTRQRSRLSEPLYECCSGSGIDFGALASTGRFDNCTSEKIRVWRHHGLHG
jgi:hypothetical protein